MIRQTHTYVTLEISDLAYQEIRSKLEAAGYQHTFMNDGAIDMHGIAVKSDGEKLFFVGKSRKTRKSL